MSINDCPFFMSAPSPDAKVAPASLNLKVLQTTRYLDAYNYAEEFKKLDLDALKADMISLITTSQDWWPADYGHYGPFFIRLGWHSAGTYRTSDGRGGANAGNMRFAPLNSWPDNGNLDKARRLLWPLKKKYGKKISWGDLMIYAATCSIEHMGSPILGFSGGRVDCWEPERDVYWGSETEFMDQKRYTGSEEDRKGGATAASELEAPLGAVQMGLIYVNPEGPGGNPDPQASANDIRDTFGRMAMNDEETVALVAGGHTFGKGHGAADPGAHVGPSPEDAPIEAQGTGWANSNGTGKGVDTITSGLEGAWTSKPTEWDNGYFHNLMTYDWELTKGPGGANQWTPKNPEAQGTVPDAHDPDKKHAPVMFTSDMALKVDPAYNEISKRFHENTDQFADAWSKAWYKLTHRDMGPIQRCLGKWAAPEQLWQDACPPHVGDLISDADAEALKANILASGLSPQALLRVAWGSACTFRGTDFRGGANGSRIRMSPQKDWAVNSPEELAAVLAKLDEVKASSGKNVSIADLIVLGGCAAVEDAAKKGGVAVKVPFRAGRTDATEEQTDAASFSVLEPKSDAFRNYNSTVHQMVDRAALLTLTAPEMSVLIAGMRAMNANFNSADLGVLTSTPGTLNNAFFDNLIDMNTVWSKGGEGVYVGKDRASGAEKWKATECDLIFGSNSELRAIAEHYAMSDSAEDFVNDFVNAWCKVMHLDRFD